TKSSQRTKTGSVRRARRLVGNCSICAPVAFNRKVPRSSTPNTAPHKWPSQGPTHRPHIKAEGPRKASRVARSALRDAKRPPLFRVPRRTRLSPEINASLEARLQVVEIETVEEVKKNDPIASAFETALRSLVARHTHRNRDGSEHEGEEQELSHGPEEEPSIKPRSAWDIKIPTLGRARSLPVGDP